MSVLINMEMPTGCGSCPFEQFGDCYGGKIKYIMDIDDEIANDVRHKDCPLIEQKTGKWLPYTTRRTHKHWWQCSVCKFVSEHKVNHNYCPNCGARIVEDEHTD